MNNTLTNIQNPDNMSLKKRINQVKMIKEAVQMEQLPVDEQWYKDRLSICQTCEFNSDNIPQEKRGAMHFVHESKCKLASGNKEFRFCTACTCCIDRKAAIKRAECGMTSIGKAPLWTALELFSVDNSNVSITKAGERDYSLTADRASFIFDFGDVVEDVLDFKFVVFVPTTSKYITSRATCDCTVGKSVEIDSARREFTMRLSTLHFGTERKTTRTFYIDYDNKTVVVKFVLQKINKNELQSPNQ